MWYFVQTDPMLHILAPKTDQERISPYNDNTVSSRKVMRIKKTFQSQGNPCIKYQLLLTQIIWIVWQIVMRITNKILGGERFKWKEISVEMFYLIDLQNKVT